jgi:hypothetical protein
VDGGDGLSQPRVPQGARGGRARAPGVDVGEEGFRGSGTVGAHQDVGALSVGVGDLCECLVEHCDVIGGGVRVGVAGPQPAGQCLAGVGEEAQQRVEAETALVGGCGLLLLGVAGDQRGVGVQDEAGAVRVLRPGQRVMACGRTVPIAPGRTSRPSQTTTHTSSTPWFFSSVSTCSQYFAPLAAAADPRAEDVAAPVHGHREREVGRPVVPARR